MENKFNNTFKEIIRNWREPFIDTIPKVKLNFYKQPSYLKLYIKHNLYCIAKMCKDEFLKNFIIPKGTVETTEQRIARRDYFYKMLKGELVFKCINNTCNFYIYTYSQLESFFNLTDSEKAQGVLYRCKADYDIVDQIFCDNRCKFNELKEKDPEVFDFFKATCDFEMFKTHMSCFGYDINCSENTFNEAKKRAGLNNAHHVSLEHENYPFNPLCIVFLSKNIHDAIHSNHGKLSILKKTLKTENDYKLYNFVNLIFNEEISFEERKQTYINFFKNEFDIDYIKELEKILSYINQIEEEKLAKENARKEKAAEKAEAKRIEKERKAEAKRIEKERSAAEKLAKKKAKKKK